MQNETMDQKTDGREREIWGAVRGNVRGRGEWKCLGNLGGGRGKVEAGEAAIGQVQKRMGEGNELALKVGDKEGIGSIVSSNGEGIQKKRGKGVRDLKKKKTRWG